MPCYFLGVDLFLFFSPGACQILLICRCRSFSELFHSAIALNATSVPYALISFSLTWVFKTPRLCLFPRAVLTSPNSCFWSLCPFLNSRLKFTSIQGSINGGFIQIGQYLTYFLPSSSVDWLFLCIFFLPKVNSTHLALKEERCYFWPQVQTVSRARHESATARLTVRGSRNCPGPRSLEYSLYIWHLTSKSTARGKKSEAGFLLEKYHSDAPFLMLAITTSFFMGTMIAKVLTPYSLPIQVSDTISPPIICKQEMSEKVSSGWISDWPSNHGN